jgi:hypothetical protein
MKQMKEWHTSLIMLLGIWISFFILLPIVRYITIPPTPWTLVIKFDGLVCLVMSLFMVPLGLMTESTYRYQRGRDMLEKLKQDVN